MSIVESAVMRHRVLIPLIPLVPLLFAAGCATPPAPQPERTPVALELQRAALDAKAALWQLSAIQQAKTGTGLAENGGVWTTPAGLDGPVSVAWVGPYQSLVSTVAGQTGYGYEPVGKAPVNPIIVRVNAEQIPAIVVLRDASWQVRDRAALEIDEARRVLRVRFHHVD
jgi:defect-in-organelle-trafficking protein DotD